MKKYKITFDGTVYEVQVEEMDSMTAEAGAKVPGTTAGPAVTAPAYQTAGPPGAVTSTHQGAPYNAAAQTNSVLKPAESASQKCVGPGTQIKAPMPGTILSVAAAAGQQVNAGDILLILEAMKMENEILAPAAGRVTSVTAVKGMSVNTGDVLVVLS